MPMIYCCAYIDYMPQLERSASDDVASRFRTLQAIADQFGALVLTKKNPLVIRFEQNGMFSALQTIEGLRRIAAFFSASEKKLRGVFMYIHACADQDEAVRKSATARLEASLGGCDQCVCLLSEKALACIGRFFALGGEQWTEPAYCSILGDADAAKLFARPKLEAAYKKTLAQLKRSGHRLLHIEAGKGVRAVALFCRRDGTADAAVHIVSGKKNTPVPFSPLLESIAFSNVHSAIEKTETEAAALSFVLASSFAGKVPHTVEKGCADYIHKALDIFGASGITLVCDAPELFSEEAVLIIADRLENDKGIERYISIADGSLVDAWSGAWAARVPAGYADCDDKEAAVNAALGQTSGEVRAILKKRYETVCVGAQQSSVNFSKLIGLLPEEARIYLCALLLFRAQSAFRDFSRYTAELGLMPETETLIRNLLSRAGLIETWDIPLILPPLEADLLRGVFHDDVIQRTLSDYLIRLYKENAIRPSFGFLHRVGERQENERLLYDCLFEVLGRPDRILSHDTEFLLPSSRALYAFWLALAEGDKTGAEIGLNAVHEHAEGIRAKALKALASAEYAYAERLPDAALKAAREAMLTMGKNAPARLEARSQRIMGLASLSLDKQSEALDYVSNAQELAESISDQYERMMSAYAKTAIEFLQGALGRALKTSQFAEDAAVRLYRMDVIAILEALRGRIDMEFGLYDDAARRFDTIAHFAKTYSLGAIERRAFVWKGRALAYAGDYENAIALLSVQDAEACVFRGELEILRSRPSDAVAYLEKTEPLPSRFLSADSCNWDSLYSEFEGRAVYFSAPHTSIVNLRTALLLFAQGLSTGNPEYAVQLNAMTRAETASKNDPHMGRYSFFCYMLEERLVEPPVDKQTVLSRAFKTLQQEAGRIEDRAQRSLFMDKNIWNKKLMQAAREHKFI